MSSNSNHDMGQQLAGKIAVLTGASGGIGSATARLFVARGARVLLTDVAVDAGQALADELGDAAQFFAHDVTDEENWKAVFERVEACFGPANVLGNIAGIVDFCPLENYQLQQFKKVVDINVLSVFLGMKHVIPTMRKAGGGSIINISSVDGLRGTNCLIGYNASKWAVRGMSKSAAVELGREGIRVNSVHPGGVNTSMGNPGQLTGEELNKPYQSQGLPRVGEPIEVARTIAFLASDDSSYTTGAEHSVDGAMIAGQYMNLSRLGIS